MSQSVKLDRDMEQAVVNSDKLFQTRLKEALKKVEKLSFKGFSANKFIQATINGLEEVTNIETDTRHAWKGDKDRFKDAVDEAIEDALKQCFAAREAIAQGIFFQVSEELLNEIEKQASQKGM